MLEQNILVQRENDITYNNICTLYGDRYLSRGNSHVKLLIKQAGEIDWHWINSIISSFQSSAVRYRTHSDHIKEKQ